MSRAVSETRRWRVGERTGGRRGGGVPRGVMLDCLWPRGGCPERYALWLGRGGARLARPETVDQAHQLCRVQQGKAPTAMGR